MKQANYTRLTFGFIALHKKVFLTFPLFLSLLISLANFIPLITPRAFAANNGPAFCIAYVIKNGNNGQPAPDSQVQASPLYKDCKTGYDGGYANPTNNDSSHVCNTSLGRQGTCDNGFKGGQKDKLAEKGKPPTADQIKKAAETACAGYKNQDGVSATDRASNFESCILGFTNQKKGDNPNNSCDGAREKAACIKGVESAVSGKPAVPGTASAPQQAATTETSGSGGGSGVDHPGCEAGGFSLSWIMCPIIEGLAKGVDGIYHNIVQPLLATRPIDISNNGDDPTHTFAIWSNFRIIANIFLVIALLVVVFGESVGGGLIDAYAAKKILPRLLVAAILINLSIYIVAFAVDITNILGRGLGDLIEAPFKAAAGGDGFKLHISGTTGDLGVLAMTGGAIWAGAAAGALGEFLLVFVLIPAFLAFIAILVVVLVRRALIIFLVLSAPIAFALYCLPNTEKYFRKWSELLMQTLLIYPIIAVIFALSNILSVTIGKTLTGPAQTFAEFLGVAALLMPLFIIPFSFKLAGGALGNLHALATASRKRGQEALKGNANDPNSWRNKVQRNLKARNADMNLSGRGIVSQVRPSDFKKGGLDRRRARLATVRDAYQGFYGKQGMQAQTYEQYKDDSNVMEDLFRYGSGADSRAAIERDFASGKIDQGDRQQRLFSSAAADRIGRTTFMRRQAFGNPATIAYGIAGGEEGWNEAMGVARELAGGEKYDPEVGHNPRDSRFDSSSPDFDKKAAGDMGIYRGMQNQYQYVAKALAGRADQSGAVDGGQYDFKRAWNSVGLYQHGNGKPTSVAAAGESYLSDFKDAVSAPSTPENQARIVDGVRFYKEQATLAQSASGAVQQAAIKNMANFKAANVDEAMMQTIDPNAKYDAEGTVGPTYSDAAKLGLRGYEREEDIRRHQEGGQ